jgi:hypothetical protein
MEIIENANIGMASTATRHCEERSDAATSKPKPLLQLGGIAICI